MGDAGIPQHLQQLGRRIGLDRIERLARKLLCKEAGGARGSVRAIEDYRFVRNEIADYSRCIWMDVQLKGPPIGLAAK